MLESPNDIPTPVRGLICPNCAHVDSIVEEKTTRPLDSSDVIGAWMFGWVGALVALTGRTTRRLRCGRCDCRFSRPTGFFSKVFWWTLLTTVVMLIAGAVAAMFQSSLPPGALPAVSRICSSLASAPLVALVLVATFILAVFLSALAGHSNAAVNRRHLYKALARRDEGDRAIGGSDSPG